MKKVLLSLMLTFGLISLVVVPVGTNTVTTNGHGAGH